jgi:hypothetical protein
MSDDRNWSMATEPVVPKLLGKSEDEWRENTLDFHHGNEGNKRPFSIGRQFAAQRHIFRSRSVQM